MKIVAKKYSDSKTISGLIVETKSGKRFNIDETSRGLVVTVDSERIMYGTEQGNNNAKYLLLVK